MPDNNTANSTSRTESELDVEKLTGLCVEGVRPTPDDMPVQDQRKLLVTKPNYQQRRKLLVAKLLGRIVAEVVIYRPQHSKIPDEPQ